MKQPRPLLLDPRHETRRVMIQALYAHAFSSDKPLYIFVQQIMEEFPPIKYDEQLLESFTSIVPTFTELDALIQKAAPAWPIDQISRIDLVILRLAIFEMYLARTVPYKVAIDEAVELAKEFGGEVSAKFINGTLGTVAKNVGLVEEKSITQ